MTFCFCSFGELLTNAIMLQIRAKAFQRMLDLSCLIYPIFIWYCHYSDRKHCGKPLLENCQQWRVSQPSLKGTLLHTTTGHSSSSACTHHRQPLWVDLSLLALYPISIVTDNSLWHPVNHSHDARHTISIVTDIIIHCYTQPIMQVMLGTPSASWQI